MVEANNTASNRYNELFATCKNANARCFVLQQGPRNGDKVSGIDVKYEQLSPARAANELAKQVLFRAATADLIPPTLRHPTSVNRDRAPGPPEDIHSRLRG